MAKTKNGTPYVRIRIRDHRQRAPSRETHSNRIHDTESVIAMPGRTPGASGAARSAAHPARTGAEKGDHAMDNPDGTRTRRRTRFMSSIAAILCVMLLCCAGTAVATLVANDTATNRFALDSGRQVTVEWREVPPSSNGNADANATFDVNRIAWNNTTAVLTAKGKSTTLNAYSVGNDGTLDNMDAYIFLSEERSEQSYRDLLIGSTMRVTGSTVLPNDVGIIYNISLDQASTERPTKTVNGKTHTYRKYRVTVKKPITTTVYESQLSDLGSVQPTIPFYRGYTFTGWTKPIATGPDSYFVRSTWEYRGEIEPDESTSFAAVYGGGTLVFGRGVAPETHDGANLSQLDGMDLVWYGIEDEAYTRDAVPWASMASKIARVEFRDALSPISTAFWFSGFSRLAEISFGKLDGSRITDMQSMFSDCTSLESADMTGLSLGKVTCINNLFYGCDALQGAGFPATFSTELRECAQVFLSCDNLPKVDMSMVETSKVTSFHRLFWGCNNLRSVDAPCVTSSAADMAGMFENCWSLPSIDVSGWDLSGVTDASALFKTCSALETIYADDPKTNWLDSITANKADDADMFSGCGKLVGGAGTKYDSGSTGAARARVDKLSGGIGYFTYRSWNGTFGITGDTRVGSTLSVQLGDVPVGAILRYQWLRGGSPISGATAKNYTTTGEDVGRYISCRLTISTEQGSRQSNALLISGPRAFAVYSADDGSLSLYKRDTVPSAGGTFEGKAATAVYTGFEYARYQLPTAVPWYDAREDVKSVAVIDEGISPVSTAYLFWGMENCSTMDLGKLDTSAATDMTYMFGLCGSLSALDLSGLDTSMVENMSLMFYKCSGISSLDVSGFDTSKASNMGKMFSGCSSLTTIYASDKWSTGSAGNTGDMFADCILLVGGCGTTYDPAIVDGTRALIDGTDGQPGYLTEKTDPDMVRIELDYDESADPLSDNPERGMYRTSNLTLTETGKTQATVVTRSETSRLLYLKVDLSAFSGSMNGSGHDLELTDAALAELDVVLGQIKQNDNSAILRFVYDGGATGVIDGVDKVEPSQDMLIRHIEQLAPVLKRHAETISAIQVGFYGLWGEAFYNTDAARTPSHYAQTIPALLSATEGTDITIAVRTPEYYSWYAGFDIADIEDHVASGEAARVCVFNDAYGASADDMGTYRDREAEVAWIGRQTAHALFGGEAIVDSAYDAAVPESAIGSHNEPGAFVDEARKLHTTYLNYEWDQRLHAQWASLAYEGESALAYIDKHLGYRFVVRDVKSHVTAQGGQSVPLDVTIENTGFASPVKPKRAEVLVVNEYDEVVHVQDVDLDVREIAPGERVRRSLSIDLPSLFKGDYRVMLRVSSGTALDDGSPYSSIRFANDGMWSERHRANAISAFTVTEGEEMPVPDVTFAVYSETDGSLRFYRRAVPEAGTTDWDGEGRTATAVYTGFETGSYAAAAEVAWKDHAADIRTVSVVDEGVAPRSMAYWFSGCGSLVSADLSGLDTSKVTSLAHTFVECLVLAELDVSTWDTSQVTSMSNTFNACAALTSLDLSSWDTSKVVAMDGMFAWANQVTTIFVSDLWSTKSVASSANMFLSWNNALVGGAGTRYEANVARDAGYAHVDGGSADPGYLTMTKPYEPYELKANVDASAVPQGVTRITYTDTVAPAGAACSNAFGAREDGTVVAWVDPDDASSLMVSTQVAGQKAHAPVSGFVPVPKGSSITHADLRGIDTRDVGNMAYLFQYNDKLVSLDMSGWDTSRVTSMQSMFDSCVSLVSIDMSGWDTSKVANMNGMFAWCSALTELDLSSFDTRNVTDMASMFTAWSWLKTIYVGDGWDTSKVASSESMFSNLSHLVGGSGTTFDGAHVDKGYAHVDGGSTDPGYLTRKELPALSGALSVSGTTHVGDKLTASAEGAPEAARLAFSWQRDSAPIDGANAATYTLTQEDVGHKVRCTARAAGYSGELASAELGPVRAAQGDVEGQLASMTLHEKVCQMFCVYPEDLGGSGALTAAGAVQQQTLAAYPYGGVCYFLQNIKSEDQARTLVSTIESFSEVPMFHAVDEEGGRVQRIGGTTYSGAVRGAGIGNRLDAMYTYRDQGEQTAYDNARLLADNLKRLGMNWDFAPVADVNSNPDNPVIGDRAYGDDFDATGPLVAAAVRGFADSGVGSCLKHFPGHGDTATDSHNGAASVSKTIEQLRNEEFRTFEAGIAAGVDAVMMGHLMIEGATESVPASCSREFVTDVLRGELGFDGVITTDGMGMGAITKVYGTDRQGHVAAVMACLDAGIDVFLLPGDPQACVDAIEAAVAAGTVSESRIDESARRILTMKRDLTSKES